MILDHIAICATDLAAGTARVEEALGVRLLPGGKHARYGTHNTLLGLGDGIYLEVIAPDPDAPKPEGGRWFGLDRFRGAPRPGNWICAVPDLAGALETAPASCGQARDLARGDLTWRIAVPDDGSLPMGGAWPTMIEWGPGVTPPGLSLPDSGIRLTRWEVFTPNPRALATRLPLADPRVVFRPGAPGFAATFRTPSGEVTLQ